VTYADVTFLDAIVSNGCLSPAALFYVNNRQSTVSYPREATGSYVNGLTAFMMRCVLASADAIVVDANSQFPIYLPVTVYHLFGMMESINNEIANALSQTVTSYCKSSDGITLPNSKCNELGTAATSHNANLYNKVSDTKYQEQVNKPTDMIVMLPCTARARTESGESYTLLER